jgi:hypothetical protein
VSERVRTPGAWDINTVVDPAEFEALDEGQFRAVDGRGGSYSPDTPIHVGGRGIEDCNAEHFTYSSPTSSVTIGPTDAHRIRIFGGANIDGTIFVLINDDAAFARKSVYVSTLNQGSRVRIRNAANTGDYGTYTATSKQVDVELVVERTELTGTDAWKLVRAVRRVNETPFVRNDAGLAAESQEVSEARVRFTSTITEETTFWLTPAPNGTERVILVTATIAKLKFRSNSASGTVIYSFDPEVSGGEDLVFTFWCADGQWVFGHFMQAPKRVMFMERATLGTTYEATFPGDVSKRILRVTTADTGGAKKTVILWNGRFPGQEFLLDHASPEWVVFKDYDGNDIAEIVVDVELNSGRKSFSLYWDGAAWQFAGMVLLPSAPEA